MNAIFELKEGVTDFALAGELRAVYHRLKAIETALFHATMFTDDAADNIEYIARLSGCMTNEVSTMNLLLGAFEKTNHQGEKV